MMTVFFAMFALSLFWWMLMYVFAKTVENYKKKKEEKKTRVEQNNSVTLENSNI